MTITTLTPEFFGIVSGSPVDLALRVGIGAFLGAAIGFERQWRARTAGVRTNALVSLGAALFVVMGAFSFNGPDADPTRVAAQIVSGIGFLGAGVIMKQGATISGLNTAATLWASAAVGALAGGGLYLVALGGAVAIMLANTLLRPLGRALDRRRGEEGREHPAAEYRFEVYCPVDAEGAVRSLVFDAVHRPEFTVLSIDALDLPDDKGVRITAMIRSDERNDREIEEAIAEVIRTPAVTAVRWSAEEMAETD
ncbi:MgtC/SapB family protein [Mycetocola saprophilus]|uniref:MgtC/SapB family protein n=1 Tax=Mycetocola saprophilus TaxID=76636 RepID=UPI00068A3DD3|nr:MgtC/SapB family protein [Mycetocola saprophilus]